VFDEGTDVPPPVNENGPEDIPAWNAHITVKGDPYTLTDPVLIQAARGLTLLRSAYYQTQGWTSEAAKREVAIFSIQGWTDDLFEAVESFRMFKYLKGLDARWPVSVALADVGHSRAQNPPDTWQRLNDQAWQFLQAQIHGSHEQQTTVYSEATVCTSEPDQPPSNPSERLTATTPEGLSMGTLAIGYSGAAELVNPAGGGTDPNGPGTDPIVGEAVEPHQDCRTDRGPASGGYTGVSDVLPNRVTYIGLGEVDVPYALSPLTTQAQLDARVWDVPPSGPAYLVTRGTYRLDTLNGYDPATGTLRLPLYGNHWRLAPGHKIRLDLTDVDYPYLRFNNMPSSLSVGSPTLILPTREATHQTLAGAGSQVP
jgi:predicted acyl esterase